MHRGYHIYLRRFCCTCNVVKSKIRGRVKSIIRPPRFAEGSVRRRNVLPGPEDSRPPWLTWRCSKSVSRLKKREKNTISRIRTSLPNKNNVEGKCLAVNKRCKIKTNQRHLLVHSENEQLRQYFAKNFLQKNLNDIILLDEILDVACVSNLYWWASKQGHGTVRQ